MLRGKSDWNVFGAALKSAAAKGLTAEQFAEEIKTDVKFVRQDYQSYMIKIENGVEKQAKAKYAKLVADAKETGEEVTKTEAEYIAASLERNLKMFELKSARGRRGIQLDIEFDLDDDITETETEAGE